MASNTLDHVAQNGHGQKVVEAMATKLSEKFAIVCLKSIENFVGVV